MSVKGDIREDGKRFDGFTWREVGLNHHMNEIQNFKRIFKNGW